MVSMNGSKYETECVLLAKIQTEMKEKWNDGNLTSVASQMAQILND